MSQATTQVIGRNGFEYDAKHIRDNLYIVGKFIVTVEDGKCDDTLCLATKSNLAKWSINKAKNHN